MIFIQYDVFLFSFPSCLVNICVLWNKFPVSPIFFPAFKMPAGGSLGSILSPAKKMTNINDWQPCRDKAAHLANSLCQRKKKSHNGSPERWDWRWEKWRFWCCIDPPNACLMHFTQDLNATYGIIQSSRSGLTTFCSVGFQDTCCINSTGIKLSC